MSSYTDTAFQVPDGYDLPLPPLEPQNFTSPALANSAVAFSGQARVFGFTVTNTKASAQFIQFFDLNAVPADGTVPIAGIDVPAGAAKGVYFGTAGRYFRAGLVLCNSSTQGSKTIGAADCLFDVQYTPEVV